MSNAWKVLTGTRGQRLTGTKNKDAALCTHARCGTATPLPYSEAATILSVPLPLEPCIPGHRPELAELLLGTPNFWRSSRLAPLTADRNFGQNQVKTKDRACSTQQKSHFHQPLPVCGVFTGCDPKSQGHTLCDRAEADMGPSVTMHSTHPHMQTTHTRAKHCYLTLAPPKEAGSPGPPVQGHRPTNRRQKVYPPASRPHPGPA